MTLLNGNVEGAKPLQSIVSKPSSIVKGKEKGKTCMQQCDK